MRNETKCLIVLLACLSWVAQAGSLSTQTDDGADARLARALADLADPEVCNDPEHAHEHGHAISRPVQLRKANNEGENQRKTHKPLDPLSAEVRDLIKRYMEAEEQAFKDLTQDERDD